MSANKIQAEKMLYNKNYTILALNCISKNSKEIILVLEIEKRD